MNSRSRTPNNNISKVWQIGLVVTTLIAIVWIFFLSNTIPADVVIINTKIWTGDEQNPIAEAIAIKGDRILFVGSTSKAKNYVERGVTEVIDGKENDIKLITPGFIDCHVHMLMGGHGLTSVDLRDANSTIEFTRRIAEYAKTIPKGRWIREGNWNHENWGGDLPTHYLIDDVTPHNPVWICRLDGHMCLANQIAMNLANITRNTKDIEGGTIERDLNGHPTGILKDNAMKLINDIIPPPTDSEEDLSLEAAMKWVASYGVTSVHHMAWKWRDFEAFQRARKANRLITRIYAAAPLSEYHQLSERISYMGKGDEWFRIGNLKGFVDGSLGSHTALMVEPYADKPTDQGLVVTSEQDLYQWVKGADMENLHVSVHAIGDQANKMILNVYERVFQENGNRDRRYRIEHAQQIRKEDLNRFSKLNVIASVQPFHLLDDGVWAEKLLGERVNDMYPFKTLLDLGTKVIFGSDWFVAPPVPLQGIYAAVTRATLDGKNPGGWNPSQKITVESALKAYTVDAAYASFEEGTKGKLKEGFLADLALLKEDILSFPQERLHDLWNVQVKGTMVGGKIVHWK